MLWKKVKISHAALFFSNSDYIPLMQYYYTISNN